MPYTSVEARTTHAGWPMQAAAMMLQAGAAAGQQVGTVPAVQGQAAVLVRAPMRRPDCGASTPCHCFPASHKKLLVALHPCARLP